jgi:outer membrane protein OmpA-like peptidoglycan-associated protein
MYINSASSRFRCGERVEAIFWNRTPALRAVARLARAHPTYPLGIEGHTSEGRGAQELSLGRASAVARALEALGIDHARLRSVGLGATHPIAPETLTSARERNERMEIVFVRSSE